MANQIFANGREVACKAGSGKTICAMPDVCFTPPENPATPPGVPVPYPNTGFASDTADGSTTVTISGAEVMLKNKSYFSKSTGDEAGCAAKNMGKVYFNSWSMDVKFEGENADRHLDMTTNNHASQPGDTPPWPFAESMAIDNAGNTKDPCAENKKAEKKACEQHGGNRDKECADPKCKRAMSCRLVPYGGSGSPNCCKGMTGDHVIEASSFARERGGRALAGCEGYDLDEAPVCCVEGGNAYSKDHGFMSAMRGVMNSQCKEGELTLSGTGGDKIRARATTYGQAAENGARSVRSVLTHCDEECIRKQIDTYHHGCGIKDETPVKAITYGDSVKWIQQLMDWR